MFWKALLFYFFKMILCVAFAITGIYIGYYMRNRSKLRFRKYITKERKRNKRIGKTRASLERYYESTEKKKQRKERSDEECNEECYEQCKRILMKLDTKKRNALKAVYNASIKDGENLGILWTALGIFGGHLVDAYAQFLVEVIVKFFGMTTQESIEKLNNGITTFLGVLCLVFVVYGTRQWLGGGPKQVYMLSIIQDIENEEKTEQENNVYENDFTL